MSWRSNPELCWTKKYDHGMWWTLTWKEQQFPSIRSSHPSMIRRFSLLRRTQEIPNENQNSSLTETHLVCFHIPWNCRKVYLDHCVFIVALLVLWSSNDIFVKMLRDMGSNFRASMAIVNWKIFVLVCWQRQCFCSGFRSPAKNDASLSSLIVKMWVCASSIDILHPCIELAPTFSFLFCSDDDCLAVMGSLRVWPMIVIVDTGSKVFPSFLVWLFVTVLIVHWSKTHPELMTHSFWRFNSIELTRIARQTNFKYSCSSRTNCASWSYCVFQSFDSILNNDIRLESPLAPHSLDFLLSVTDWLLMHC